MRPSYSKLLLFLSALALAAALLLLPSGAAQRLRRLGGLAAAPAEEMAAMGARISREALGGLPPGFTLAQRDELLQQSTAARIALQGADRAREKLEAENRTLHALFRHVRLAHDYSLVVTEVVRPPVWRSAAAEVQIDRGAANGIRPGQAVLTPEGLAGVVVETSARRARVRLVSDANFALAGEITARKVTGIVENDGKGLRLSAPMGAGYADIRSGDQVFTTDLSGEEMQSGLLIGVVTEVGTDANGIPECRVVQPEVAEASPGLPTGRFLMVAIPAAK